MITLDSSHDEVLSEFERVRHLYELKKTLRYESRRDTTVHSESVAEHIFGMFVLVDYFLPLEDPKKTLDRERIRDLILYHEIGEIETGDIISHKKSDEQRAIERQAAERVAARLPSHMAQKAIEYCVEFEDRTSREAAFAYAIDKLEPIFEMISEIGWPYFKEHDMNKEISVGKKAEAAANYPYMRRFLDVWTDHMVSKNVFAE